MNHNLTPLEQLVLKLMMREKSANEIAIQLKMSLHEVESVRKSIFKKLQVTNNVGLTKAAFRLGIIK